MPRPATLVESRAAVDARALVLVGRSPAVSRLRADMQAAADAACVLIEAERGLDVGDVAHEMHQRRSHGPFVTVECGAAEPAHVEIELFGDAQRGQGEHDLELVDAASAVARANGGTLYLAEVSDLSASAQLRLARIVRDGEVSIGGACARVDLTVIASIAAELDAAADGRLRRDLQRHFTRTRIVVPPLRRRPEDLPLLVEQLVAAWQATHQLPPLPVTHPAMTLLSAMPWRGNLVELRHAVARLVSSVPGGVIQLEDVLAHVRFDGSLVPQEPGGTLRAARQQFERDYIALVIRHHHGHIGEAARALGIQRTNLYRKARQLGIAVARSAPR
jgi:two-component system nitrogen regulation response regulator NtrX